jgi:multimeric flavodoxin WrbA
MSKVNRKRALGIVGSARRGGNTETLVDEVLRGAQEAGASAEKVILSDLTIAPCQGCDACLDTGECVHEDDFVELLEKMRQSDVWVLGTPVYWWGPSAQFKTFVDRWYQVAPQDQKEATFKGRRIIAVIPLGDTDAATARHVVGMLTDALEYLETGLFATVVATGVNDRGQVREHADVLAEARRAGQEAVGG